MPSVPHGPARTLMRPATASVGLVVRFPQSFHVKHGSPVSGGALARMRCVEAALFHVKHRVRADLRPRSHRCVSRFTSNTAACNHRLRGVEPSSRAGRCPFRAVRGILRPTSPPFRSRRVPRQRARPSDVSPRIERSMTLLLAAVGATVAALFELTVGTYLRVGDAQPHLVLVGTVIVTIVDRSRTGTGLGLRRWTGTRCPGRSTSRVDRVRAAPLRRRGVHHRSAPRTYPTARTDHRHLRSEHRVFDDVVHARIRPSHADPGHGPTRDRPSGRRLRHDPGDDHRAAGGLDPRSTRAARTGRLVSAYIGERAAPVKQLSRFLVFGLIVIIAISTLTARLFYLQIIQGTQASRARRQEPDGARVDPVAARPDLRPQRATSRHEHRRRSR